MGFEAQRGGSNGQSYRFLQYAVGLDKTEDLHRQWRSRPGDPPKRCSTRRTSTEGNTKRWPGVLESDYEKWPGRGQRNLYIHDRQPGRDATGEICHHSVRKHYRLLTDDAANQGNRSRLAIELARAPARRGAILRRAFYLESG